MRDHWLFAIAPYAVAAIFAAGVALRVVSPPSGPRPAVARRTRLTAVAWRLALALVALAHIAALAFPDAVLMWTRQEVRLIALEVEGLAAGLIALIGGTVALSRTLRAPTEERSSTIDVIALTLVVVTMASGVSTAVIYRWASAWAEVTLVPYLYSVARLHPSTGLVTSLPVLVKLHMASAFLAIAVFPFTSAAEAVVTRTVASGRRALTPLAGVFEPAWQAIGRWTTARARIAAAGMFGNGEEEN
jgi:nitrate reductase gamma subunit